MLSLLLLFTAPVIQIVLSILRIKRLIALTLNMIPAFTVALGFILSFVAMELVFNNLAASNVRCGLPGISCLFCGFFITLFATPVISMFFYFIDRMNHRSAVITK